MFTVQVNMSCLQRVLAPVLKAHKSSPDNLEEYKTEFGAYLGPSLHAAVVKARQAPATAVRPRAVTGQVSATRMNIQHIGHSNHEKTVLYLSCNVMLSNKKCDVYI